jgi:hypothetical protein
MVCDYYFSKKNNVLRTDAQKFIINELEELCNQDKEIALITANFYLLATNKIELKSAIYEFKKKYDL